MTGRERVIAALQLKEPDQVPIFEWSIDKKMVKLFDDAENIYDLVEAMDLDGIVFRADYAINKIDEETYTTEWGCIKKIGVDGNDVIIEPPIKDIDEINSYKFPDPESSERFLKLQQAVERFGTEKAVVVNVRDIFSDIRDLFGYENALVNLMLEPEKVEKLLDKTIEYNIALASVAKQRCGTDILVTTDDYASNSGLLFSPDLYKEFFYPKYKKLIRNFKDMGYYCMKHTDGNIMDIMDLLVDSGIDCIDPIDPLGGMNIAQIKKKYGSKICIKGNIDTVKTLVTGSLQEVEDEVKLRISQAGYGGGYIVSSSNTIHSGVKPENFLKMVESVRKYGKYPLKEIS